MNASSINYRVSGHDSFQCRYAWLPKAIKLVKGSHSDSDPFGKEDKAMVEMGVGKNMVRSISFWSAVTGIIEGKGSKVKPSKFGELLLGHEGYDEFLENIQTLWLLHWKIATNSEPLLAWDFFLNHWHRSDFTRDEAIDQMMERASLFGKELSRKTLDTHLDVFLHTYLPTKSRKGEVLEDNLDCPLVELRLLKTLPDRVSSDRTRRVPTYAFRIEEKHEISDELFVYCLDDFWNSKFQNSQMVPFRDVCIGIGSPGQVFKLPERYIRERLDRISARKESIFRFNDNDLSQQLVRANETSSWSLLERIYDQDPV